MGNCPKCCQELDLSFHYENIDNDIKFVLYRTSIDNRRQDILYDKIEDKDPKFLDILNKIIKKIYKNKKK